MQALGENPSSGNVLFSNVYIRRVVTDAAVGGLHLRGLYAQREYVDVVFLDVFYSQLGEGLAGSTITLAEELSLEELGEDRHAGCLARFYAECADADTLFLKGLVSRGYRFFTHYVGKTEEYLVVAKWARSLSEQD